MKQGLTEIITIMDKSGSMDEIKTDAIGGFNSFVDTQKKLPGQANFTLALFDTNYELIYNGTPIKKVKKLTDETYVPNGNTALHDAVGKTLNEVGVRLYNTPEEERPEKVIVAIITDGQENSSKEFTRQQVFEMIKHQQEVYSWEFVFLAANQDAFEAAQSLSINASNTLSFAGDSRGITCAYTSVNAAFTNYRTKGSIGDWKSDENTFDTHVDNTVINTNTAKRHYTKHTN